MSRFVRASKYRHVFGQQSKKEHGLENVKVTNSAWDTNVVSASGKYLSINWQSGGGGAFAILPLPSPFAPLSPAAFPHKLPDSLPLARSHTAPVLDTDWSPHDDSLVASGAEDGKALLWTVPDDAFDGWGTEGWEPKDWDPVLRLDVSPRKVGQILWHPTAKGVLATSSGEHVIKLWDIAAPEDPRLVLQGHTDAIQSLAFNPTGTLLATTARDRKLRLYDLRAGPEAVHTVEGHGGVKSARVSWMGDINKVATTGFSKMSDRQVGIWDVAGGLANEVMLALDQSAGVVMPFYSDNGILFLAGKGDGNIRYYEFSDSPKPSLFALSEYKSTDPQRGMCFLPRRALSVENCEIARAYKVTGNGIEAIGFVVPRKADSFQSDIYPPAPSLEPSLSADEFFSGKKEPVRKVVDLASGSVSSVASSSPIVAPTKTEPAIPPPAAAAPPVALSASTPSPATQPISPVAPSVTKTFTAPPPEPAPAPVSTLSRSASSDEVSALKSENSRLTSELREARETIRNLELALEAQKANARKAAEALLHG